MQKPIKVAFAGSHAVGKTTLVSALADRYPSIPVIQNETRKVPRSLRGTTGGQFMIWDIYNNVLSDEPSYICDRSMFDICAYSKVFGAWTEEEADKFAGFYRNAPYYPDLLFYLPIEFPAVQDDERPDKRDEVDECIQNLLATLGTPFYTVRGSVQERADYVSDFINNFLKEQGTSV